MGSFNVRGSFLAVVERYGTDSFDGELIVEAVRVTQQWLPGCEAEEEAVA